MNTLQKTNTLPSLKSIIENFWTADGFLSQPIFASSMYPTANIIEKDNTYELTLSAPGFKKNDFKIENENGQLTITAETSSENKEEKENYLRKEFSTSSFSLSFRLPDNITEDQIKANYEDGLLRIHIIKNLVEKKVAKEIKID